MGPPSAKGLALRNSGLRAWLTRHQSHAQIAQNTGWILSERFVSLGTSLIVSVILARYLGTQQFGLLNYAIAIVAIFAQLARFGMSGVLVRELILDPTHRGHLLGTALTIRLVGSVAAIACVALTGAVLLRNEPLVQLLVLVLALGFVFDSLAVIESHFQGLLQNRTTALLRALVSALAMLATGALVWVKAPILSFALVATGQSLLLAGAFVLAYQRRHSVSDWRVQMSMARGLLGQSWPLILSGVTASLYLKIDQVMLGAMAGGTTVGIYAAAVRLSEGWYFIPTAIATAAFPLLLRAKASSEATYERRLQALYDVLFWAALCVTIPVSLLANVIVVTLYGPDFFAAGPVLALHVWAGIFIFLRAGLSKWLIAEKLTIFSLVTHGSGAVVNIALNLLLIPMHGAVGAAVATLVSYAVASYFALFLHPRTRRAALQMTLALLSPVRLAGQIRRLRSERNDAR